MSDDLDDLHFMHEHHYHVVDGRATGPPTTDGRDLGVVAMAEVARVAERLSSWESQHAEMHRHMTNIESQLANIWAKIGGAG